jgi:hypothetical protein
MGRMTLQTGAVEAGDGRAGCSGPGKLGRRSDAVGGYGWGGEARIGEALE